MPAWLRCLLPGLALLFVARFALAAHALALGYAPKYPAGFSHFDYVNPQAPKGGEVVLPNPDRRTSFDSFNPFVIKGTPAPSLSRMRPASAAGRTCTGMDRRYSAAR